MQDEAGGGGTGAVCDLFPRHFSPGLACLLRFLIVRPAGAFFAQLFLAFLFNKLFFFLHFFLYFFFFQISSFSLNGGGGSHGPVLSWVVVFFSLL